MIPHGVDINNLAEQLNVDGVAFTNPELAGAQEVQAPISDALAPRHGIAVVDVVPAKAADARDIAQELQDITGLDTVIVQTPINVSTVSDSYARAEIEAVQQAIPQGMDQVSLLNQFYAGIDGFSFPWGLVALLLVATMAVAAWSSFRKSSLSLDG
ncbi:DUF6676 family protein [Corynebacterium endometrii]|uniref:Uncharacterized protein n=1 Tax=Corynebacterium endometrii TaxID=2488819 RepID=A0A4P7QG97_9CORY|nr:DUF6676 family protein [Corynebacterium endometrii]QCB28460.1 hypothetical protein CENDO_05905 [Corynebacterium endometrii]